ncbi:hypothetical protein Tco_1304205, partial [Tanacetum coccineum]
MDKIHRDKRKEVHARLYFGECPKKRRIREGSQKSCDNHDLSRLDNQSIERDRLIGIGFVLNFMKFISFTFGDKEMILVIEAIIREVFVKLLLDSFGKLSIRILLRFHFHVDKRLGFLRGVNQKELGKESANKSGVKFIPCFDISFIEFIQR